MISQASFYAFHRYCLLSSIVVHIIDCLKGLHFTSNMYFLCMGVKAGTSFLIKLNLICGTERYVIRMEKLHLLHFSFQSNNNLGWQFTFIVFDFSSKMPTEAPSNGGSASPAPSSRADRFAHYLFLFFLPSGKVTTLLEIFKKVPYNASFWPSLRLYLYVWCRFTLNLYK